ncbi:SUF system NifU family Fe-S cluster assembly protein [Peptoniphilus equinus]|uniref:SUF system NifU family Fe-S cluster assembly protein n=1 Tax=Peptoniphilus equinus TaxID=3016343 RepID=A0ABY7QWP2_9FIRM|nr:SUF system NifU family Fe-S cluster assembly protein [Peptoniphilus equinus]WBW50323.1 SUF system NifU family Fe-S cluster assembly protein [Peptoniphilus equinus]
MNLNDIYTELILEQSRNKRNRRHLDNPDFVELGHNPSCGDEITLEVKVDAQNIVDASYTGVGCAISQASTSIMIDTIKGLDADKAHELAVKFIAMVKGEIDDPDELDELDDAVAFESIKNLPARVKCAVLPWYTLKEMIEKDISTQSFES